MHVCPVLELSVHHIMQKLHVAGFATIQQQSKGAITHLEPTTPLTGFYSTVFLVPKKEGQWRPVIYLKALNSWVQPQDGGYSHGKRC